MGPEEMQTMHGVETGTSPEVESMETQMFQPMMEAAGKSLHGEDDNGGSRIYE